jgi:hypothetical protein
VQKHPEGIEWIRETQEKEVKGEEDGKKNTRFWQAVESRRVAASSGCDTEKGQERTSQTGV